LDKLYAYVVGENQQANHIFLFDQNTQEKELSLQFHVQAYATLNVAIAITHTDIQLTINCVLEGDGAQACINGAYILSEQNSIVIKTMQHHQAAHTSSTLVMKGALRNKAHAQYAGTIRVEKEARGAYASQENKNILLSSMACAVSVPNLEVLTNEVKCFHGSAVGTFDKDQLLYMAARGIDAEKSQELLLDGFFADVINGDELNKRLSNEYI
jgi:Fe-S cluster assembly protein SufD